jgi:hypothetical protein
MGGKYKDESWRDKLGWYRLDLSGSEEGLAVFVFELCNALFGSTKC